WLPLRERVSRLAAASLLARYWQSGSRHELALALAGMLAHGGWSLEEIDRFVCAVARAADDEEWPNRRGDVRSTRGRTRSGKATTGARRLAERIGERVVRQVREWLGLTPNGPLYIADSGFQFTAMSELLARPIEEQEWVVQNMLPTKGLSLLVGKPKA